jgi:putative oxidoreductase
MSNQTYAASGVVPSALPSAITTIVPAVGRILSTRIAAAVLFLFALATAVFFHSHFGDQNQFIHFFKNIAIAGGLLHVVAFGGGRISLDGRRGEML